MSLTFGLYISITFELVDFYLIKYQWIKIIKYGETKIVQVLNNIFKFSALKKN